MKALALLRSAKHAFDAMDTFNIALAEAATLGKLSSENGGLQNKLRTVLYASLEDTEFQDALRHLCNGLQKNISADRLNTVLAAAKAAEQGSIRNKALTENFVKYSTLVSRMIASRLV